MNPNLEKATELAHKKIDEIMNSQYPSVVNKDQIKEIQTFIWNYKKQKQAQFYAKEKNLKHIGKEIKQLVGTLKKEDSRAEIIFMDMLEENNIIYEFQYKIGPYKADFFIKPALVVEIDGPQHKKQQEYDKKRDAYMEKMGYIVFRIPLYLLTIQPQAIIEEIKEYSGECQECRGEK